MNNKGMQLLEELKKVPNFQIGSLENDLDEINLNWEKTNKVSLMFYFIGMMCLKKKTNKMMLFFYCCVDRECM